MTSVSSSFGIEMLCLVWVCKTGDESYAIYSEISLHHTELFFAMCHLQENLQPMQYKTWTIEIFLFLSRNIPMMMMDTLLNCFSLVLPQRLALSHVNNNDE